MASCAPESFSQEVLASTTKLRNLKLLAWNRIVEVLKVDKRWLEVAGRITKPNNQNEFLYSANDISILEGQSRAGIEPAQAFLAHWSTTGIRQPTLEDLISILIEANLYQAANCISMEILKVPAFSGGDLDDPEELRSGFPILNTIKVQNNPEYGGMNSSHLDSIISSQHVTLTNTNHGSIRQHCFVEENDSCRLQNDAKNVEHITDESEELVSKNSEILIYKYVHLAKITKNFHDAPFQNGGSKIGEGAFGTVYCASTQGRWIAVKRLKDKVDKQFLTELEVLTSYKHENLLPLLGYSHDGPRCCLVYAYMSNGSLQERLACLDNTAPIQWTTRIAIACGTAKGINHLHTFGSSPLVHRDIKSANVLLDKNLTPKVGDFGLARTSNSSTSSTVAFTLNIIGTSVYMAREAFNGEVSVRLDTFSYGVVLMELLTGLAPYDADRDEGEKDLISYMEENCDNISDMLDNRAGNWDKDIAGALYKISKLCIETRKKDRPKIAWVLPDIEKLMEACCK